MWVDLNSWKRPSKLKNVLPEDTRKAAPGMINAMMTVIELAIGPKPIDVQWEKYCEAIDKAAIKP